MHPLLGFDIGNTRIKAAFSDARGVQLLSVVALAVGNAGQEAWLETLLAEVGRGTAERGEPPCREAVIAMVNPPAAARLETLLAERGIQVREVLQSDGRLFEAGVLHADLETPTTTGIDRLLSALGALKRVPANRDVVVVDAGSAITINWITHDRYFRGGAILPGIRLMSRALSEGTVALPEVLPQGPSRALGRSTHDAICCGIFHAAVGAVHEVLIRLFSSTTRQAHTTVFLTGGDREIIASGLRYPFELAPHLVVEGLFQACHQLHRPDMPSHVL